MRIVGKQRSKRWIPISLFWSCLFILVKFVFHVYNHMSKRSERSITIKDWSQPTTTVSVHSQYINSVLIPVNSVFIPQGTHRHFRVNGGEKKHQKRDTWTQGKSTPLVLGIPSWRREAFFKRKVCLPITFALFWAFNSVMDLEKEPSWQLLTILSQD